MKFLFSLGIAVVACLPQAQAQQTLKALTPSNDSCRAYVEVMQRNDDSASLLGLAGWVLGFWSGVAQGSGIDILQDTRASDLFQRLYAVCKAQPDERLSVAAEQIARILVAKHHKARIAKHHSKRPVWRPCFLHEERSSVAGWCIEMR